MSEKLIGDKKQTIVGKKIARIVFAGLAALLAVYLTWNLLGIILTILAAVFLAYLLEAPVKALQKRGTPRLSAVVIVCLLLLFILLALVMLGIPSLLKQLEDLLQTIPQYGMVISEILDYVQQHYERLQLPVAVRELLDEKLLYYEQELSVIISNAANKIVQIFSNVVELVLVPVLAFYFLKDLEPISHKLANILPQRYRSDIIGLVHAVDGIAGSYIKGNLLVCLLVGLLTGGAMFVLGLDYPVLLGFIAGVTELIPYFGPLLGAVPAVALALLQPEVLAWQVILAMVIIQQLENNIITPKVLGNQMGLHPALVIVLILAGGKLFGLAGMLLVVPVTAAARVIVGYIYLKLVE